MIICGATKNFVSYTILWLHSKIFHGFEIFSFCEFFITISNYWNHVILRIIRYKVKVRPLAHCEIEFIHSYHMGHIIWFIWTIYCGPYNMDRGRPHEKGFMVQAFKKGIFSMPFQVCDELTGNDQDFGVSIFGQPHVMQGRKSVSKRSSWFNSK